MTSRIDISNGALVELGVQRITAPNDPAEAARVIDIVFERLARAELRKQAWSFALVRTQLGALAAAPLNSFTVAFQLPTDLLRLVTYNGGWAWDGGCERFSIEGRALLTNDSSAQIRYVRDLSTDTALWDAAFVDAFTYALAAAIAPTLTKDKQKGRDVLMKYQAAIKEAKRTNAIERAPTQTPDGSWVTARYVNTGLGTDDGYRPISPVADGTVVQPFDFAQYVEDNVI